ncbi:MAG: adenylate kinase [Candidatus Micrarchaeota archaeon]|nr:adenylate kinase [Candidatus Micrarchaeota archaeon]
MIIVMGLPGAGKSTILQKASTTNYVILNYGTLMFQVAEKQKLVKNRDEMRKLEPEQQKNIQRMVVDEIKKHGKNVILDTHCSIKTPKGYLPGLPYYILKELDVEKLVYVTAEPHELIERRKNDPTRVRDPDTEESILEHDTINRTLLATYAALTGATINIIINRAGKLDDSVKQLEQLLT